MLHHAFRIHNYQAAADTTKPLPLPPNGAPNLYVGYR